MYLDLDHPTPKVLAASPQCIHHGRCGFDWCLSLPSLGRRIFATVIYCTHMRVSCLTDLGQSYHSLNCDTVASPLDRASGSMSSGISLRQPAPWSFHSYQKRHFPPFFWLLDAFACFCDLRVQSCIQDCLLEHLTLKPSMWCRQACGCFAHHAGRQSLTRALNRVRGEWVTLLCHVFGNSCHDFEHTDLCSVFRLQYIVYSILYTYIYCTYVLYIHNYTQSTVYFSTFSSRLVRLRCRTAIEGVAASDTNIL